MFHDGFLEEYREFIMQEIDYGDDFWMEMNKQLVSPKKEDQG